VFYSAKVSRIPEYPYKECGKSSLLPFKLKIHIKKLIFNRLYEFADRISGIMNDKISSVL